MKIKITAQQVYETLINEDKIFDIKGQIKFYLGDVNIIVKQKDVVGNIIQEWLQGWFEKRKVEFLPNENEVSFPDTEFWFYNVIINMEVMRNTICAN